MHKFCPNCGVKLEQEFKFCPECGFTIKKLNKQVSESQYVDERDNKTESVPVLICEICGEENNPSNSICAGCGARLKNTDSPSESAVKKEDIVTAKSVAKASEYKLKKTTKTNSSNTRQQIQNQELKKLNRAKIIAIISVGLGISLIILIFSGALDFIISPTPKTIQNIAPGQNSNSVVDLASIQKINDLQQVVKDNPKDTSAILDLAHARNDANLYDQAIESYKQYLVLVPNDPDARIDMGICYYNLKDYDTAINEMERAIKIDPKHQIGFLDLGIVNLAKGDLAGSKKWLQKAVDLDPGSEYGKKAEELLQSHSTNQGGN